MNKFAIVALLMVGCSSPAGPAPNPPQFPPPSEDAGSVTPPPSMDAGGVTPPPSEDAGSPTCLADSVVCTSTPNACCSGICSADTSDPTQPSYCAASCTTGAECESGCCAPLQGSSQMSCAGVGFCANTCKAPGDSCTATEDCCLDNGISQQCVGVTGGATTCASECTTDADCVSGCCALLTNLGVSVCAAVQFCE